MKKIEYLEGQEVGKVIFIKDVDSLPDKRRAIFLCRCGNRFEAFIKDVKKKGNKATVSCGCYRKERMSKLTKTHGKTKTKEFNVWTRMIGRCYNEKDKDFKHYGGRGIVVCDRWRLSFSDFLEDMGLCNRGLTIERMDVNGNYSPDNCKWATVIEQANNKRSSVFLLLNGKRLTVTQWSRELNLRADLIFDRLRRGWSHVDALTIPVKRIN